jgi:MraZ protein
VFRGDYSLNLDAKGRLAVPARFRALINERGGGALVVTVSLTDRCLTIYPLVEWQRIEEEIQQLPTFDRQAQAIRHLLIGRASEVEMDAHGRILLPPQLREWAHLDKRVQLVGQVRKFELWNQEAWLQRIDEVAGELMSEPSEALRSLVL